MLTTSIASRMTALSSSKAKPRSPTGWKAGFKLGVDAPFPASDLADQFVDSTGIIFDFADAHVFIGSEKLGSPGGSKQFGYGQTRQPEMPRPAGGSLTRSRQACRWQAALRRQGLAPETRGPDSGNPVPHRDGRDRRHSGSTRRCPRCSMSQGLRSRPRAGCLKRERGSPGGRGEPDELLWRFTGPLRHARSWKPQPRGNRPPENCALPRPTDHHRVL
jgi:hypothetical protein